MAQCSSEKGYMMTTFRCVGNKSKCIKTHRIVAESFVSGKTDLKNEVNHIDGDKCNNSASNLEWVTRKENVRHGFDNGLIPVMYGERNGRSRLTEDVVIKICAYLLLFSGHCKIVYDKMISSGYNVTINDIHDIKYKKRWVRISDIYFSKNDFN